MVDGKLPEFKVLDSTTVALRLDQSESRLSRPDGQRFPAADLSPGSLPEEVPRQIYETIGCGHSAACAGPGPRCTTRWTTCIASTSGSADAAALDEHQPAAGRSFCRPCATRTFTASTDSGHQLPYSDPPWKWVIANDKLIAAKAGTGESDLQARGLCSATTPFSSPPSGATNSGRCYGALESDRNWPCIRT